MRARPPRWTRRRFPAVAAALLLFAAGWGFAAGGGAATVAGGSAGSGVVTGAALRTVEPAVLAAPLSGARATEPRPAPPSVLPALLAAAAGLAVVALVLARHDRTTRRLRRGAFRRRAPPVPLRVVTR